VRQILAGQYAVESRVPDVQVVRYERDGDRSLHLRHCTHRNRPLTDAVGEVVKHLHRLWGFAVRLETWNDTAHVDRDIVCPA
jgi:stage V sporulation protein R